MWWCSDTIGYFSNAFRNDIEKIRPIVKCKCLALLQPFQTQSHFIVLSLEAFAGSSFHRPIARSTPLPPISLDSFKCPAINLSVNSNRYHWFGLSFSPQLFIDLTIPKVHFSWINSDGLHINYFHISWATIMTATPA